MPGSACWIRAGKTFKHRGHRGSQGKTAGVTEAVSSVGARRISAAFCLEALTLETYLLDSVRHGLL
jgi:hypothetical protein